MARRALLLLFAVTAWAAPVVSSPHALATGACSFDATGGIVSVTVETLGTVSIGPGAEIHVDGTGCASAGGAAATVSNTAAVVVTGSGSEDLLRIDLTGGGFGEISWAVDLGPGSDTLAIRGTDDRDSLTVGSAGFSLGGSVGSHASVEAFALRGLAGNDVLSAAGGTQAMGGLVSGPVTIVGGPGNDRMHGGLAGDEFRGGPGRDLVTYLAHETGITATLDRTANDGVAGEDFIRGDVENLMGSLGPDLLVGNASANRLAGAPGSDVLEGGGGRDRLRGEQEDDVLRGGRGDDLLRGGRGEDVLQGQAGRDTLEGDHHPDVLRGGGGDDALLARDGWIDAVIGGGGTDRAYADVTDDVAGCEVVTRGRRLEPSGQGLSGPAV